MIQHWCGWCSSCRTNQALFHRILNNIAIAEQRKAARERALFHQTLFGV